MTLNHGLYPDLGLYQNMETTLASLHLRYPNTVLKSLWGSYYYFNPTLLSFSILMAIFPGEPALASFIGAKDDENGGDN